MDQEDNKKEVTLDDLAMMVQGGFDDIEKRMVTKEDAKNFLTKDDAKDFLTKEDAKKFATKDDLKSLATKTDLQGLRSELNTRAGELKESLVEVKTELAKISTRTKEDTDAYGVDIVQIKSRLVVLEHRGGITA